MNHGYPIYTVETECQDCYKCLRHCPVKAIKVSEGHATVIPEMCVGCGKCVEICPAGAKRVRNGINRIRQLIDSGDTVYVSLAPSWVNEFSGISAAQMIAALKNVGFTGVSETALGAQAVSAACAEILNHMEKGVVLSTACPAAVDYVSKYIPAFGKTMTPLLSPLLAHCKMLRDLYGPTIKIVFIGPCIAKKNESDRHPELLNVAVTYKELSTLFDELKINPKNIVPDAVETFVPYPAEEGALYPIEGGMSDTIKMQCQQKGVQYVTLTGLENIGLALDNLYPENVDIPVFVEILSCPGGCVHGPGTAHNSPGLLERVRVIQKTVLPDAVPNRTVEGIADKPLQAAVRPDQPSLRDLREALHRVGKDSPDDELNCGGCGYEKCRDFAKAMIAGNAEPKMCVSYLRKQAQKKANAILRCIPTAVVIVDKDFQIIESNRSFALMFGQDTLEMFDLMPGLTGADLRRIVPFANLFEEALLSGKDIQRNNMKVNMNLYNITVFTIEAHETVGAVIYDVTQTEMHREQIAERARQVIDKNLMTVQEIACRLGEHMADTELLLRSIANDYATDNIKTVEKKK